MSLACFVKLNSSILLACISEGSWKGRQWGKDLPSMADQLRICPGLWMDPILSGQWGRVWRQGMHIRAFIGSLHSKTWQLCGVQIEKEQEKARKTRVFSLGWCACAAADHMVLSSDSDFSKGQVCTFTQWSLTRGGHLVRSRWKNRQHTSKYKLL